MIVAFEGSGDRLERCSSALLPRRLRVIRAWSELERQAPNALCAVVLLEWLRDEEEDAARLRRFRRRFPCLPVVLVTRGCMENARSLKQQMVEEVVWLSDLESALPAAVRRATAGATHHTLAGMIAEARHLPRALREALAHACLAPRPVYSVADLAAAAHCDRTTLCLQWRKAVGPGATLRLVDFLGLILLMHAGRRRLHGRKWAEVAMELEVHEHTLRRLATRLVGPPSRAASGDDLKRVAAVLDGFVRAHLVPAPADEASEETAGERAMAAAGVA